MSGWGGKRKGAGRKPTSPDGLPRKPRGLKASDDEWVTIKEFAKLLKNKPEKARELLRQATA